MGRRNSLIRGLCAFSLIVAWGLASAGGCGPGGTTNTNTNTNTNGSGNLNGGGTSNGNTNTNTNINDNGGATTIGAIGDQEVELGSTLRGVWSSHRSRGVCGPGNRI